MIRCNRDHWRVKIKGLFISSYRWDIGIYTLKFDIWIFLVLLLSTILNFYGLTDRGIRVWDEGDYLDAAKSVLEGDIRKLGSGGYKFVHNAINTIFFAIFGANDYSAFFSSAIFGVLTVYLTYLIGEKLFGHRTGLFAALILSVTEYFIYFSRSAYSDGHATFFLTFTMFVYISGLSRRSKSNLIFTGLLAGICYATRNTGILVLPIIFLIEGIFFISRKQNLQETLFRCVIFAIFSLLIIAPLTAAIHLFGSHPEIAEIKTTGRVYQILSEMGQGENFYFYVYGLLNASSPITLGLLVLGITHSIIQRKRGDKIILVWFLFLYIFLSAFQNHRFRIFTIALPAMALLASRGLIWLKRDKIIAPIMILLIALSLLNAYNTIALSSLGYKNAAEVVIQDNGAGVITTDVGKMRFYLSDLPLTTLGIENNNNNEIYRLSELHSMGYTHLIIDFRGGRITSSFGRDKVRNFREKLINEVEPLAVIENNNLYVDEFNKLWVGMANDIEPEEIERYSRWLNESWLEENNLTEDMIYYDDRYALFRTYYYLFTDPYKDYIYVFRISDVLRDIGG